jgi:CheY-like chemotaxis protein
MRAVVLIDPSPEVRAFVRAALPPLGWPVESAGSLREALERLRHLRPELVLWDVSGAEADPARGLAALWAGFPGAAVIALSGGSRRGEPAEAVLEAAVRAGAWGALAKPFRLADLLVTLAAWRGRAARCGAAPALPWEALRGPHWLLGASRTEEAVSDERAVQGRGERGA